MGTRYSLLDNVDQVIDVTEKAVHVRFTSLKAKWIPRSVIEEGDDIDVGDTDVVVAEWFVEKEGLDAV